MFIGAKGITNEETDTLMSFVDRFKCQYILEIGTFFGWSTAALLSRISKFDDHSIVTVDDREGLDPSPIRNLQELGYSIEHVKFVQTQDIIKKTKDIISTESFDLIYIDTCHDRVEELWSVILENHKHYKDYYVVLHDVMCEVADAMRVPVLWQKLKKSFATEEAVTYHAPNQYSGFGIVCVEKEHKIVKEQTLVVEPVTAPIVEVVEEPVAEPAVEPVAELEEAFAVTTPKSKKRPRIPSKKKQKLQEQLEVENNIV